MRISEIGMNLWTSRPYGWYIEIVTFCAGLVLLTLSGGMGAPPEMVALQPKLNKISKGFRGRLGYHLRYLDGSGEIGYRDTERFPSASTIKTVVMLEAFLQIEEGKLAWDEKLAVPPLDDRQTSMWVSHLQDGKKIDIDGLIQLMMNVSENTATVMLAGRVGVEQIENRLLAWGFKDTACTIRVPQSNQRLVRLRSSFANMGVTSPREMATLLEWIGTKKVGSQAACDKMIRILSHQYWDDFIAYHVPPEVVIASKVGALNRSRSDSAIVFGKRPYVLTIYTDNQKDQNWSSSNEGDEAIRTISKLVWEGLNPDQPYSPPEGMKKWAPTGGGVEG